VELVGHVTGSSILLETLNSNFRTNVQLLSTFLAS